MPKSMIGEWLEQTRKDNEYIMCPVCKNVFRLDMLDRKYTDNEHTELTHLRCFRCDWQDKEKWLFVSVSPCKDSTLPIE